MIRNIKIHVRYKFRSVLEPAFMWNCIV